MTDSERKLCEWQLGLTGDFYTQLINAAMRADSNNFERLKLGFPELMEAIYLYKTKDGYWAKLSKQWNDRYPNSQLI